MVLCFLVIDLAMLVVYSAVQGSRGELGAERVDDDETSNIEEGVRPFEMYSAVFSYLKTGSGQLIFCVLLLTRELPVNSVPFLFIASQSASVPTWFITNKKDLHRPFAYYLSCLDPLSIYRGFDH